MASYVNFRDQAILLGASRLFDTLKYILPQLYSQYILYIYTLILVKALFYIHWCINSVFLYYFCVFVIEALMIHNGLFSMYCTAYCAMHCTICCAVYCPVWYKSVSGSLGVSFSPIYKVITKGFFFE